MVSLKRENVFMPNIIKMNVHSATCICSMELYKQWYTLADFFAKLEFSRGFLYTYIPEGTAKLRWARGHYIFIRVPRSSVGFRVAQKIAA
jgi:hypothetical protein